MKLNKHFTVALASSFLTISALSLASCGENTENNGTDDILSINTLTNDIEYDENNEVIFPGLSLDVWTIIGDPDLSTFKGLVDDFNMEYRGQIHINLRNIGHYDFYGSLENTWAYEPENAPDVLVMHNEKTAEYAARGYMYPLDTLMEEFDWNKIDFSNAYENIDRSQFYSNHRFGIPIDGHGFIMNIRQDIIKKNGLGFDNNTRFVPKTREEFQSLLEALREKADAGTLLVRNINRGQDHSWKVVNGAEFYPEFLQSTDPDGLGALYANGGSMADETGKTITFGQNKGFQTYLTDQVERFNDKLMGEAGVNTAAFSEGKTVFFSEGPWWTSLNYDPNMNNSELRTVGNGVTEEEVNDPVYAYPLTASNTAGWWTLEENEGTENGSKWYGNGHAISITRHVTSATTALAALEFANWLTQGTNDKGEYYLAEWSEAGHVPARKNVYESEQYQALLEKDLTLRALGDPANIISMEPLQYETTIFNALANAVSSVQSGLKGGSIKTTEQALTALNDVVNSAQGSLDLLSSGIL